MAADPHSTALPVHLAALELGVSEVTLRRWIRAGAPLARRGRRGRGGRALVNPRAVAAWRGAGEAAALVAFASEVPELVAGAVAESFAAVDGPHKRACAGVLAATWYAVTVALLDRLRRDVPELRDPLEVPLAVERLRKIVTR